MTSVFTEVWGAREWGIFVFSNGGGAAKKAFPEDGR